MAKQKLDWLKQNRIFYYKPLGGQVAFHAASAHVRLAVGKNRGGKTTAGCVEDISFCLGFYPWMIPKELFDDYSLRQLLGEENWRIPDECRTPLKTPVKVLVIEDDWDTADEILVTGKEDRAGKFTYYIPPDSLACKPVKNALGYICEYQFANGSVLRIDTEKSFTNDPNSFEGGTNDLIHYDEPKRRELRVALKRGLVDRHGYEIFTMTPLSEPWIFHEVYKRAALDPDIQTFFFDTDDIIRAGHISQAGWDAFVGTLNEDEIAARARGEWVFLKGLVYPEFNHNHCKDDPNGNICDPLTPDYLYNKCTIHIAIDPHPRQPLAALFMAADDRGRLIVFDEIFKKDLIGSFCELIKSKLGYMWQNPKSRQMEKRDYLTGHYIIDPIAFIDDPVTGLTWADEFTLNDIPVEKAPKNKSQGILEVRAALKAPTNDKGEVTGEAQLLITSNCIETIREFQTYVYQEWKHQDRSAKEKPVDRDDHMMENLYRLILIRPSHTPREDYNVPLKPRDLCPVF